MLPKFVTILCEE